MGVLTQRATIWGLHLGLMLETPRCWGSPGAENEEAEAVARRHAIFCCEAACLSTNMYSLVFVLLACYYIAQRVQVPNI